MKKRLSVIILLVMIISISGCSNQVKITSLSFSDYYKEAEDFEEIRPYLEEYFSYVCAAYERSNEKGLETFVLADGYENAKNALAGFSESDTNLSNVISGGSGAVESHLAKLDLLQPYLQIELMLAEKDLLLSVNNEHVENKDWFQRLDTLIWDSIDEYRTGTGD